MKYEYLKNKLSGLFGKTLTNEDIQTIRSYCREYEYLGCNKPKLNIKKHATDILKLTISIVLAYKCLDLIEIFICKMILYV